MKKFAGKHFMVASVLSAALFIGMSAGSYVHAEPLAQNTTVAVNVQVQQDVKGSVDWTKGAESDITATGTGLPPANMGARGTALARRAAIVDAYRNLAETIHGVQVDSETVMQDLAIQSDTVRASVSALVKGAKIIEEGTNPDGSYYVRMRIPLYGATDSLASVAIPEIQKSAAPEPLPQVAKTNLPKNEVKEVKSAGYTGVIVDAYGLGLEATFSPVIYDTNGRAIYGMKNINADYAISKGMVEYAAQRDAAVANSRAGSNPLVIKAVEVKGGRNSANRVNVVVSVDDGDKILLANEKSGMLQNCAVVFVK